MKLKTHDTAPIVSIIALCVYAGYLYPSIQDPVAIHWGLDGSADGFADKNIGIAIFVAIPLIAFLCFKLFLLVSPEGFRMTQSRRSFTIIVNAVTTTLAAICAFALFSSTNDSSPVPFAIPILLGSLFVILGNYMGKIERNWIFGIRTPWTLASEEVWYRTHRVGRWIWVTGGLLLLVSPMFDFQPMVLIGVALGVAASSVLYSFVVYLQVHGLGNS